ncbi:MAG: hypothetical protein ABI222_11830, partial [Opitutaceae bacterium]
VLLALAFTSLAKLTTVNRATEIRLLAERQMGAFLKEMPKATGYEYGAFGRVDGLRPEPATKTPRLRDMGITNQQSHMAQKLADIPEDEFRERIALGKAGGGVTAIRRRALFEPLKLLGSEFPTPEW